MGASAFGQIRVNDNVECVDVAGIDAVAGENVGSESALQRGEAENRVVIVAESELNQTVAESADSVIREGWERVSR